MGSGTEQVEVKFKVEADNQKEQTHPERGTDII